MSIAENATLGKQGERIARHLLQQALDCNVPPVTPDRGLDALVEFVSPAPGKNRLYLGIQVKTGFSFVEEHDKSWKVKIAPGILKGWKSSSIPVMFIWVHPSLENAAYWHLVTKETSRDHFFISKRRLVTPATRYDLALRLEHWDQETQPKPVQLLTAPLHEALKPTAKAAYRALLEQPTQQNPLLGPVRISWHGWRHISGQRRSRGDISQSLQLLPAVRTALAQPLPNPVLRRLGEPQCVGRWIVDSRLVIFEVHLQIKHRADAHVKCIVNEQVRYRTDWVSAPNAVPSRTAVFESIYERGD